MSKQKEKYSENLFQWIWDQVEFTSKILKTSCGSLLEILDPGRLNHGAGPDFLHAHLRLDGLELHGSVEIHRLSSEWNQHNHQNDSNFNSVILHVVFDDDIPGKVVRQDGSSPITLSIKPYLNAPLSTLAGVKGKGGILCKNSLMFINQSAFEKQIERAAKEYFTYKVEELLERYEPSGTISESWRNAMIIQIYRALGIPANIEQMQDLAIRILAAKSLPNSQDEFIEFIKLSAFEPNDRVQTLEWRHSGMRPASRPAIRVEQAALLHYRLALQPLDQFLKDPEISWSRVLHSLSRQSIPGINRLNLIKHTVYLPSVYLLGQLLVSKKLMDRAYECWLSEPHVIPDEVKKPFIEAGFQIKNGAGSLGLAHQLKRYCKRSECANCYLFKSAIRS